MYSFVNSIALARSIGSQWREVDLSEEVVHGIYANYVKVYLTLHNTILDDDIYVDMDSLRLEFSSYQGTLNELLVEIGNRTLVTVPELPSTDVKYVKYADAVRSRYKVKPTIAGQVLPENYPASEMLDLEVTRPSFETDMSLLYTHCLLSVNGLFHWDTNTGDKAYAMQGAVTMRKSKLNHLGIHSFLDVGEIKKFRIDPETLQPVDTDTELRDKLTFTLPETVELDNKSFFLILGGYLVFPEQQVFWQSGQRTFTLDLNQIPYLERILESKDIIDLSSLELTPDPVSETGYNVDELYSDAVIKKYFALTQTFFVTVNVQHLSLNKLHLRHSTLPGMFTSYQDPSYPLIVGYGKVAEYWKTHEDGYWSVTVADSFYRNFTFSQKESTRLENISDQLLMIKPFYQSKGYLLEIGGYNSV